MHMNNSNWRIHAGRKGGEHSHDESPAKRQAHERMLAMRAARNELRKFSPEIVQFLKTIKQRNSEGESLSSIARGHAVSVETVRRWIKQRATPSANALEKH